MLDRCCWLLAVACLVWGQQQVPALQGGRMPPSWVPASGNCMEQPEWAVQEYNPDLYILRQSGCTNYEKPFLYLLLGSKRALLLDSGAGKHPNTAGVVGSLLQKIEVRRKQPFEEVVVLHSHGHGDHIAGDAELRRLPRFRVVPAKPEAVAAELGIGDWPAGVGSIDLGGRVIDALAIPGHEPASIALYDRATGVLLTGDSLYPGRLYVRDWPAYRQSIARLLAFVETRPVAHILGAHIEQTATPFLDYPTGTIWQPNEHSLDLSFGTLAELDRALKSVGDEPVNIVRRDFTVVPRTPPKQSASEVNRRGSTGQ